MLPLLPVPPTATPPIAMRRASSDCALATEGNSTATNASRRRCAESVDMMVLWPGPPAPNPWHGSGAQEGQQGAHQVGAPGHGKDRADCKAKAPGWMAPGLRESPPR